MPGAGWRRGEWPAAPSDLPAHYYWHGPGGHPVRLGISQRQAPEGGKRRRLTAVERHRPPCAHRLLTTFGALSGTGLLAAVCQSSLAFREQAEWPWRGPAAIRAHDSRGMRLSV